MDQEQAKASFIATATRVASGGLPLSFLEVIERHVTTLSVVINSIRNADLDEEFIITSIRDLVEGYENQLIGALKAMQDDAE
ncbi:MAG: hypothetical protein AAGL89_07835 [Pseudomonadota bacterium]